MAMTLTAVKAEVESWYKPLLGTTVDPDGAYGAQCKDLISHYIDKVHGEPYTTGNGDEMAENLVTVRRWARVSPSSRWQAGDVVSQWTGYFGGHVYVVIEDLGSSVRYVDQNGVGSAGAPSGPITVRTAKKANVLGVARPPRYVGAVVGSTPAPVVSASAVLTAGGLSNVPALLTAVAATGVPLWIAAAVMEQESGGKNVYGADSGGIFSPRPNPVTVGGVTYKDPQRVPVTASNFRTFESRLLTTSGTKRAGVTSNGVGPWQITWWENFPAARKAGKDLSNPRDNAEWGMGILRGYLAGSYTEASVKLAATRYNAGPDATVVNWYGLQVWDKAVKWRAALAGTSMSDADGGTVIVPDEGGTDPGAMPETPPTTDGSPGALPPETDPGARPVLATFQAAEVTPLPAIAPGPVAPAVRIISRPRARVRWRDQWWSPTSWSTEWEQGVSGPDQSPWGAGMVAATGNITLLVAPLVLVHRDGINPVRDNPPMTGEPVWVEVMMDGGLNWHRIFTGVVADSSGTVGDFTVSMSVVENVEPLAAVVSVAPKNFRHPSPVGGHRYKSIGLHAASVTAELAARGHYRAVPRWHWRSTILAAPMLGCLEPEVGVLEDATTLVSKSPTTTIPSDSPEYVRTWWGLTVANTWARYRPVLGAGTSGRMDQSKCIRVYVAPVKDEPAFLELWWRTASIMLTVDWRGITVETQDGWKPNGWRNVLYGRTRGLTDTQKINGFELVVWLGSDKTLAISIDGDTSSHKPFPSWPQETTATEMSQVRVTTRPGGTLVGAVQVYSAEDRTVVAPFSRNLILDVDPDDALFGVPALEGRTALDLLREQAEKGLTSLYLDEVGRLWSVGRKRLDARPSVRTLTTRDLRPGTKWSVGRTSVYSALEGTWRQPAASQTRMSSSYATTVWESSSDSIRPGDTWEDKATPPADVDWIDVDRTATKLAIATLAEVNSGVGTVLAGTTRQSDRDGKVEEGTPSVTWFNAGIERETWTSYPVEVRYTPPAGVVALLQLAAPEIEGLSTAVTGKGLVLRARARQVWKDFRTPRPKATGCDLVDRTYTHEGGWWIQSPAVMDKVLTRLGQMFAQPLVAHDDVELAVPDPGIRRMSTITLSRDGRMTPMRVSRVRWEGGPGGVRQVLALRQIHP